MNESNKVSFSTINFTSERISAVDDMVDDYSPNEELEESSSQLSCSVGEKSLQLTT
jgi:hypothetical protein